MAEKHETFAFKDVRENAKAALLTAQHELKVAEATCHPATIETARRNYVAASQAWESARQNGLMEAIAASSKASKEAIARIRAAGGTEEEEKKASREAGEKAYAEVMHLPPPRSSPGRAPPS